MRRCRILTAAKARWLASSEIRQKPYCGKHGEVWRENPRIKPGIAVEVGNRNLAAAPLSHRGFGYRNRCSIHPSFAERKGWRGDPDKEGCHGTQNASDDADGSDDHPNSPEHMPRLYQEKLLSICREVQCFNSGIEGERSRRICEMDVTGRPSPQGLIKLK